MSENLAKLGSSGRRSRKVGASQKNKFNIEVWLSLVERYVREQITAFRSVNFQNAENP